MQTPPSLVMTEISSWAELALLWLDSHSRQILSGALAALNGRIVAIGDDAAICSVPSGMQLIICTDTLVAGVHFP